MAKTRLKTAGLTEDQSGNLTINGALSATGNATLGDSSTNTVTVNGAMTVGNGLSVTGALSATGNLTANGTGHALGSTSVVGDTNVYIDHNNYYGWLRYRKGGTQYGAVVATYGSPGSGSYHVNFDWHEWYKSDGATVNMTLAPSGLLTLEASPGAGQTNLLIKGPSVNNNWGGRIDLYSNNGTTVRTTLVGTSSGLRVYNDNLGTPDLSLNASSTLALRGATASTGTGIAFPATQSASSDANTLDDYEEGTWTPSVTSQTGTITTVGSVSGKYTKIGNRVDIQFDVTITNNGTGATTLVISGLPFTISGNTSGVAQVFQTGAACSLKALSGTTQVYAIKYDGTYPIASTQQMFGSLTYFV